MFPRHNEDSGMNENSYGGRLILWWMVVEGTAGFLYYLGEFAASGFSAFADLAGAGISAAITIVLLLLLYGRAVPLFGRLVDTLLFSDLEEKFVRKGALWFAFLALAGLVIVLPMLVCTSLARDEVVQNRFFRSLPYITVALAAILVISVIIGLTVRPLRKNPGV